MDGDLKLPCDGPQSGRMLYMFNKSAGKLQGLLGKGEYALLRHLPMFESDFIQINKRGEVIDVHNSVQMVTVGIAYTSHNLTTPDIMLLAQPAVSWAVSTRSDRDTQGRGLKSTKSLELTRLLPLKVVKISIYNHEKKQFHLKFVTGRSFYLQLSIPPDAKEDLFACWEDLVSLLRPPVEAYSGTLAQLAGDILSIPMLEEEDRTPAAMELHGKGDQDQLSLQSLPVVADVSAATSLAYAGGEGVQQHDAHTYWVPRNSQSFLIPAPVGPDRLAAPGAAVAPMGSTSGVAGGRAIGRPVTETPEGPFIPFLRRDGNVSRPNGGQRASQLQAVLSGKRTEKADAPTERPNRLRRAGKDRSSLQSHGTTRGKKTEERNSPQGHGHGFPVWERASLSSTLKGSRLSQKLKSSWSKTMSGFGLDLNFHIFETNTKE